MTINFSLDSPPPPSPFQRWATDQLGLPPTATAGAARTLLRDRLRDEDFVPPLRWQQAVQVLGEKRAPGQLPPATVLHDEERRLDEVVSEFAGKFFTLPVDERRARWQELLDQGLAQPLIQQRLRALEPGLKVVPQPVTGGPACEELAEQARELFTLHGTMKAVRRQAFLTRARPRIAEYERAAQQLARNAPAVALPEPLLIEYLANWGARQFAEQADRTQTLQAAHATRGSGDGDGKGKGWIAIALILGALSLIRAATSSSSGRNYTPTYAPPPTLPFLPPVNAPDNEGVRAFLERNRADRALAYADLRRAVEAQAPQGPAVIERLQLLLPAEMPRAEVLSVNDMRFLLLEIRARRFDSPRLLAIVAKLNDEVRLDRP